MPTMFKQPSLFKDQSLKFSVMDGNLNLGGNGRFDIDDLEIEKME